MMWKQFIDKGLLLAVVIFGLLVIPSVLSAQGNSEWAFERVKAVQEAHTDALMARQGVVGTAIGQGQGAELAVLVLLERPGVGGIPETLDGIPVKVVVTGKIVALSVPTARFARPVPIGVSTGHPDITAGTIGCRVKDESGNVYALSNNHVYANQNDASIGDYVLQPGPYDGGKSGDEIGNLFAFKSIVFSRKANNQIDAAIAEIILDDAIPRVGTGTPDDGYRIPNVSIVEASIDQAVQKFGRTTKLTHGAVTGINATVLVSYGSGRTARFVNQILIVSVDSNPFSSGGDSGSLIVTDDANKNPVGLLFAGSDTFTIANPIDLVLTQFDVTIDGQAAGPLPTLDSISVTPNSATIEVGQTKQFTATGTFSDSSTADLTSSATWASSNTAVATVNASGLATGIAADTTNITAAKGEITSNVAVLTVTVATTTDTVTITKAEYRRSSSELNVEATSSEGGTAELTLVGYGPMTYDSKKKKYIYKDKPVDDPQNSVSVESTLGGRATLPVKYR